MRFSEFFKTWSNQYYSNYAAVGKKGDFYTAVSVGELFGYLCAKRFVQLVLNKSIKLPIKVVEIGANEGYLINDFARYLKENHLDIFNEIEFCIIEPYEKLRKIQNSKYDIKFTHFYLDEFVCDNAFFIANELFDAFECELYLENKLGFVENNTICFKEFNEDFLYLNKNRNFIKGEFCPSLFEFLKTIKRNCEKFYFLSFDYFNDFLNDDFTLRIFKNHELIDPFNCDLLDFFGKCDITYSVNYDEFSLYLNELNLKHNYKRQNIALMDFGIEEFSDLKYVNQIKYLMFGFSSNFKCLEFYN